MPVTNLKRVQLGQEVTWGTGVAATVILMGVTDSSLTFGDELYQSEQQGFLYPSDLVAETKRTVEATIDFDVSYEDICYLFDGILGDHTGAGTESPYTWTYSASTNAVVAPREYTIEYGMADAEYEMDGAIFNDFTISGDIDGDGIWQASCNLIGKSATNDTMASLTSHTVELVRVADTVVSIDAVGGTMGATVISDALISFELSVEPGFHLKHFNGAITPGSFGYDRWSGTLDLVLEYTATVKAFVDALVSAKVEKQIRLVATSGTKVAQIDFCGALRDGVELFDDRDGNATVNMSWTGQYNSTYANWLAFEVQFGTSALT